MLTPSATGTVLKFKLMQVNKNNYKLSSKDCKYYLMTEYINQIEKLKEKVSMVSKYDRIKANAAREKACI